MEKEKQKAILVTAFLIILFYWIINHLEVLGSGIGFVIGLFMPFILGGAIAFIMNVPMRQIEKRLFTSERIKRKKYYGTLRKMKRAIAYLLTLFAVFAVMVAIFLVVVPEITSTVTDLIDRIPKAYMSLSKSVEVLLADYPNLEEMVSGLNLDWDSIVQSVVSFLSEGTKGILNSGIVLIGSVVSGITTFFIAFVFSIYILFQKENLKRQGKKALYAVFKKERVEKILDVLGLTCNTFASFISGQCLEAVILGTMFVVAMLILQLPYAWLMGVIISATALIPMVGAFIGCGVGVVLILIVDPVKALIFIIMFLVLQQVEGNLIYPHVVGKSVGLQGMWVLMAVTIGGSLYGIIGMITFIPLASVCYALFSRFANRRLKEKKITIE